MEQGKTYWFWGNMFNPKLAAGFWGYVEEVFDDGSATVLAVEHDNLNQTYAKVDTGFWECNVDLTKVLEK